ncbi:LysM domain-containing protein [Mangrovibacter sp. SLW1]
MKPELVKLAARVCLGVQLTGVLSCALVPVMALANEKVPARMLFSSRTALYTFKAGDTVASVANQFGLSVAELRTLNEFRKYNKPFEKLSTGDEVDVPVQELNLKSPPGRATSERRE